MKSPLDFDNSEERFEKYEKLIVLGCLLVILAALILEAV
jgi:hypothetical protein